MKSLSSVGLGLSVVFGCLLLALVAEVYYLLWWKKRMTNNNREIGNDYRSSPVKELFYMFCLKKKPSSSSSNSSSLVRISEALVHINDEQEEGAQVQTQTSNNSKDFLFVPPRFLFTIVEETKEDLESEDGNKSTTRGNNNNNKSSLSDLLFVETPYLTPMASPSLFTSTPPSSLTSTIVMSHHNSSSLRGSGGFNPLFESLTDVEFNRIKSSPPPKFKFLQDAEDKLRRKLQQQSDDYDDHEVNGSSIAIVVDK